MDDFEARREDRSRALSIGERTVVAMTCNRCGELKDGPHFERYRRSPKDRIAYITRRCRVCRWYHMAVSLGR